MSSLFRELGYGSTFSASVIMQVLEQDSRLTSSDISALLSMMSSTHTNHPLNPTLATLTALDPISQSLSDQMKTWNLELFFPFVISINPSVVWAAVLRGLDMVDTEFKDANSVAIVLKASKAVIQDMNLFPVNVFLEQWQNRNAQISFLNHAIKIAPEIFTMSKFLTRYVVSKESIPLTNLTRHFFTTSFQSPFNSMELCELIVDYSEGFKGDDSFGELVEVGLEKSPDLLLLAFASLTVPWSGLVSDLGPKLVTLMISGHIHSAFVLARVWEVNSTMMLQGMLLMYQSDNSTLNRIVEVCHELNILSQVLEQSKMEHFTLDLACLGGRREHLNLEKWLVERIRLDGFVASCLEYLEEKVVKTQNVRPDSSPFVPLSLDVTTTFLRVLRDAPMSGLEEMRERVFTLLSQLFPRLEMEDSFPLEIEEEANSFYERIYKGELSIAQVVDLLQGLKMSAIPREQETFKCMIHNLFDEYKFFARYPDRELLITSILFGVLIQNQIVTSMALGIALRYVLEALRQPVGSKLFQFGIQALAQFQNRLLEWPQYCSLLVQIDHLHQTHPEVIFLIQNIQKMAGSAGRDGSLFTALQLTGLELSLEYNVPSEQVQEKILFIVNNVTLSNTKLKALELKEVMGEEYHRWFSNYIVVKRVSIEPNFHLTYVGFLEEIGSVLLDRSILFETLLSIKDLVNSEKTVNSSQERSYLKNLGGWLGSITLAKNVPIKHLNIAFKELLMEGFEYKRLIVVIPFVCKVLEQCGKSKVFMPPNPWLSAVMKLLAELYHYAELKLNLKFEIEVLCKNIKLDIKDITPSESLRKFIKSSASSSPSVIPASSSEDDFPNLATFITFNPNISLFSSQPSLKRIVHIAIDRSIREVILSPVVERSVTIAIVATREIVVKDFYNDQSEDRMRKAAQYMVQSLAGSLASVSSREPLKVSMISNLRSLLVANGFTEQHVPESVVFVIVSDNLDLACRIMEKAAAEKSLGEVEESLGGSYACRRKWKGGPFVDETYQSISNSSGTLSVKTNVKSKVYEDFVRIGQVVKEQVEVVKEVVLLQQVIEKSQKLVDDLDTQIHLNEHLSLQELGPQHGIKVMVQQLFYLISQSQSPDESCLVFSEKIVKALFLSKSELAREVYVLVVRRLADFSKPLASELAEWFMYSTDARKYDVKVTLAILRADIISTLELDIHMARQLECLDEAFLVFCLAVMRDYSEVEFYYSNLMLRRSLKESVLVQAYLLELDGKGKVGFNGEDMSREVIEGMFNEWFQCFSHPASSSKSHDEYVKSLNSIDNPLFFRVCVEVCVDSFTSLKSQPNPYQGIDAFARLVVLLIKHLGENKVNFSVKIMSIIVLVLVSQESQKRFDQKPFLRMFSSILNDLKVHIEDQGLYNQILCSITNTLHTLKPTFCPAFTFAWVQLLSHRSLLVLLAVENQKYFPFYHRLIKDLLEYLTPQLQVALTPSIKAIYEATLRIFLLLLHDFPLFLTGYHHSLLESLPHTCVQLKNIITSAYPPETRLPDPFDGVLALSTQMPILLYDYTKVLGPLKGALDSYFKSKSRLFLDTLVTHTHTKNIIPALVLYIGVNAANTPLNEDNPTYVELFTQLVTELDVRERYTLLQAIVNQLRYPNKHTSYYSAILLSLFMTPFDHLLTHPNLLDNQESLNANIKSQVTRVLLERLIADRPHPYGVLATFIKLVKLKKFAFWECGVVQVGGGGEIEGVFRNVLRGVEV